MSTPSSSKKKEWEYVKLNVGGMLFQTTTSTLTKYKDNMLARMFSGPLGRNVDKDGWVFIDRCGKHFGLILNFLRDGNISLPKLETDVDELRAEANFYCISQLVELCNQPISIIETCNYVALPKTLVDKYIKTYPKPAIALECSLNYTYAIEHLELFEKFSLEFNKHILFIKCLGKSTSHKWIFYDKGKPFCDPIIVTSNEQLNVIVYNILAKLLSVQLETT